ncbi:ROK family protein [Arthrobacter oryzae]|uniref:ROK family protein n=1 Tax=Arthrobacter oryzae TaxID=409290 RepID=UPI00286A45F0|nr:ROK family protein [Arthrobacter oryzae]
MVVHSLLERELLVEKGSVPSTGGRPQKRLAMTARAGYVLAADLGGSHARVGVMTASGEIREVQDIAFTAVEGPELGLASLVAAFEALIERHGVAGLTAIGIALPGPVDFDKGMLDSPSRMPGWHHYPVRSYFEEKFRVPVIVDNDANAMAYGELIGHPEYRTLLAVKAGSAIGAGFIVDGNLYRGATGAAGDITHVRVAAGGNSPCSCGKEGCLETVASGAALVRILNDMGIPVGSSSDVVRLAKDNHPEVTNAVRHGGDLLGQVLAPIVNFTNPDAIYLGGMLSSVEPFLAAVRSQLYQSCHPLATRKLVIEATEFIRDSGVLGIGHLALEAALTSTLQPDVPTAIPSEATRRSTQNA